MPLAALLALAFAAPKAHELTLRTNDHLTLHGTYLDPAHVPGAKFHAVVLLPGSGPTDRDGNQPPSFMTNLLKDLAEAMAAHGVATFRFDKRACQASASQWPIISVMWNDFFAFEHFRDDAASAIALLKRQPGVDGAHVGLLGHSEGGLIALAVGSRMSERELSGMALLGTGGRPFDLILNDQISDGLHQETKDQKFIRDYMAKVLAAEKYVRIHGQAPTGDVPEGVRPIFSQGTGKLMQTEMRLNPLALARAYPGKVLVVQGELDNNISFRRDFPVLKAALASRPHGTLTAVSIPSASHNLKHVSKQTDPGDAGPTDPRAIAAVVRWAMGL